MPMQIRNISNRPVIFMYSHPPRKTYISIDTHHYLRRKILVLNCSLKSITITFKIDGVPDEEGDVLDGDLLVGGEDDGLHLRVLAQHPDEQPGQVWVRKMNN